MLFPFCAQGAFCLQAQNEISAMQFACKYSLVTNSLGYCGKENAFLHFQDFLQNPSQEKIQKIKTLLDSFFGLRAYLDLIARANNKNTFDFQVLEAYWLGNKLLENVSHGEIKQTILSLQKFGLPEKIAVQKADSLPFGTVPHHSLHVLHVNFVTRKLKPVVKNLSECIVSWAEIRGIEKKSCRLKVKAPELKILNGDFVLQEKNKLLENQFSLLPANGDFVSVHWNNAIEIIEKKQLQNLKKATMKNIELINMKK